MEKPFSHSKPPTFSSKTATSYDDVFGGPPNFATSSSLAPRPEDYSEIFGGFRLSSTSRASCSIPVLDLPAVHEDIGAAFFDYSEVFGGFNDFHFAVPFDELFRPCNGAFVDEEEDEDDEFVDAGRGGDGDGDGGGGGGGCSSDEAWTPAGTDSLSDDSDHFESSEMRQCFSSVNPHQQSESKQFNVSYHKVNPGASAYTPNTVHVAQLNDMPGYTCVVDEATLLREIGKEKCSSVVDDTQEVKKKTRSHASDNNSSLKAYGNVNPTFSSTYDVNLRTEPSHLPPTSRSPPVVADKRGDFSDPSLGPQGSEKYGFEETFDCGLPPFFDMEVDASSSAAVSAAAVEDAMEKAQAQMKTAKESRDRKDKSQTSGKLHLHTDANGGESIQRPLDESLSRETKVYASDRGTSKIKNNAKARHTKSTSQNLLNILAVDQQTEKPAGTKQGKRNSLSSDNALTDAAGQWKEATQYYEFVNNEDTQSTPQTHSSNGDAKTETIHQGDDDGDWDSDEEACVAGENRRRLKAAKSISRQEYYEKMVKVALEVHDGVKCGNVGPDKKLKHMPQGNSRQQKPEFVYEPEMLEIPLGRTQEMQETAGEAVWKEKDGNRSNNELENEEEESQACHNVQVDKKVRGLDSMVKEASFANQGSFRGSCTKDEGDCNVQDTVEIEHEQRAQESLGKRTEIKVGETSKQKRNKETRKAVEDVSGTKTWKTGETQDNNTTRNLQQRDAYEDHVEEAVDDRAYKRTQDKCVKQDKCKNDKKFPEQAIGKQRLDETEDLIADFKRSEEVVEQVVEKVNPEKDTKLEQHVQHKNFQACEMDKLWCNVEDEVDGQGPKTTLRKSVELEKSATNTEVPEQVLKMERLDDARDLNFNKNSEEFQGQDKRKKKLEKIAEQEPESLKECELRESTKINEHTDDKADYKGLHRNDIKFEWVDEDQGPVSSSHMELPVENNNLKQPNGTKLYKDDEENFFCEFRKSQKKADGLKEVTAEKEHSDISPDVLIDEKKIESDVVQEVSEDSELEGRSSQASDTLDLNEDNIGSASDGTEQTRENEKKEVPPITSDPKLAKDVDIQGGRKRNLAEGPVLFDQEQHSSREGVTKEHFQKASHFSDVGQSFERKGNIINHNYSSENKEGEKERDLEKVRLQKLEEERERLREREKDRMAVEMTIREARDRAYVDARDRAERAALERATDEARQRAMTEARERLEKACAEARERSLADKESRLRAERAAVERATAEARQRAIEKARAERTTFEARDRMQRSVSEKYLSERDVIMRQSSFPASNERFETANSEPAQRCKARLERHRRTVERVAKALAEKNMRDLVAQREQAERTRIAETLDADIRRWSSGKEGNLRALLSTLQYILGPDSGWQPIPLTEVITAAAVKKAYRKATLCVHPDKLQQRGATIQQKYTCEKVFDLLKEAWNRFNSEEK